MALGGWVDCSTVTCLANAINLRTGLATCTVALQHRARLYAILPKLTDFMNQYQLRQCESMLLKPCGAALSSTQW
jgi:hypothetical protein